MKWIKTADQLPEDQGFKGAEDKSLILISAIITDGANEPKRLYETAYYDFDEFLVSEGVYKGFRRPDYWCEIEPPDA